MLIQKFDIFSKAQAADCWQEINDLHFEQATVKGNGQGVYDPHARRSGISSQVSGRVGAILRSAEEVFRLNVAENLTLQGWQLLRYGVGDKFSPHQDAIKGERNYERKYTVLVCFQAAIRGGGTRFVNTDRTENLTAGQMLVWQNMTDAGDIIQDSLHEGCEVLEGVKMVAVAWFMMPNFDSG